MNSIFINCIKVFANYSYPQAQKKKKNIRQIPVLGVTADLKKRNCLCLILCLVACCERDAAFSSAADVKQTLDEFLLWFIFGV